MPLGCKVFRENMAMLLCKNDFKRIFCVFTLKIKAFTTKISFLITTYLGTYVVGRFVDLAMNYRLSILDPFKHCKLLLLLSFLHMKNAGIEMMIGDTLSARGGLLL
jgi:hypothetical protein